MTKTLKGLIIVLLLCSLSHQNSFAQYRDYDRNMSLGLTFNPNIGWLKYDNEADYKASSKVGYSYGLVADLGFARNYYFSTGLLINTLYSSRDYLVGGDGLTHKDYRLQYAEVPFAIKLKTNEGNLGRFYGQFGITAGVKVSGKERENESSSYKPMDGDDIFRLGLLIGAGAEWRLTNSLSALTGISYNNGFTRTMKDGAPKLSYVGFNIGLLF